ncbi:MAG TPA: pyruvate, phosphate dikinase [Candidatus Binatia bacterium]|nr:pyruvate, phosphate dikinase [Candidatus Binatia bacterium]
MANVKPGTRRSAKPGKKATASRAARAPRYVYSFGNGRVEEPRGVTTPGELLGGKGGGLFEMTRLGIPVPPGFTITTEAWAAYEVAGRNLPAALWPQVLEGMSRLEAAAGLRLGDASRPLLVSVRSGARVSMPGMMDTVLNLGLNDKTVAGLARWTKKERFAWDCYRRFVAAFGDVILGIDRREFEGPLEEAKAQAGVTMDAEVPPSALRQLVARYKDIVAEKAGQPFPQDPSEQLRLAIVAVFNSWFAKKAVDYRRINRLGDDTGTAVTVMAMVFGNLGDTSGTGVCFTRDPSTGERVFFGELLMNAQGEDVVAGIRTPEPLAALETRMPAVYRDLVRLKDKLERHYRDMQDIEFTVQERKLYLLQTRSGKRTGAAAVRIAVEMAREGLLDGTRGGKGGPSPEARRVALMRVDPAALHQLLHPRIDPEARYTAIARGLSLGFGAAVGRVVLDPEAAVEAALREERVILVRTETSPEDVAGMHAAQGVLTARGGLTSHAAVVARGMGKCCVVGASDVVVDEERRLFRCGRHVVREGQVISLNGATGEVVAGPLPLVPPTLSDEFKLFVEWARAIFAPPAGARRGGGEHAREPRFGVRANADTPEDARKSLEFGAQGIGLVRTEHMFFGDERIPIVREMILARDVAERRAAVDRLLPFQREDFIGIFIAMDGRPVTIRLLDPPLHEFLPKYKDVLEEYTKLDTLSINPARHRDLGAIKARLEQLIEVNPMLGHRGCRLGITFPEIYDMQVRAIIEAACAVTGQGGRVAPEIMIPLTGTETEMLLTERMTRTVADAVMAEKGVRIAYTVGTMIEVPRASLIADKLARHADFFSFGTNDLTQMTFGYSRDDIGKFLPYYLEKRLLPDDPFAVLDQEGVGEMIRIGIERGRRTRPDLKVGICGEHGGEPSSVRFCHHVGMTYVSCSPYMVPIAWLAAAQAEIQAPRAGGGTRTGRGKRYA